MQNSATIAVELDADPTGTVPRSHKTRGPGHTREHRLHVLLDIGPTVAMCPGRHPLRRGVIGDHKLKSTGSKPSETSCVSPVITTTACWIFHPRTDSSSSSGMWISSGLTWTPQSMPCSRCKRSHTRKRAVVLVPVQRSRGCQRVVRSPATRQAGRRTHHPTVIQDLDHTRGPRVDAVGLDLRDPFEPGCGRELARHAPSRVRRALCAQHRIEQAREALLELVGPQPVEPALAVYALGDDTRLTQNAEVMRAGGLRHREDEAAAGLLPALGEQRDDPQPDRVAQRMQNRGQAEIIDARGDQRVDRGRRPLLALHNEADRGLGLAHERRKSLRRPHRTSRRNRSICKRRHGESIVREVSNHVLYFDTRRTEGEVPPETSTGGPQMPHALKQPAKPHLTATLILACLAQFMVILDVSVVNVALPSMKHALDFTEDGLQWVVNAYTVTFAGFLLLGGRAADLLGRRRVFVFGLVLFSLASLACGLADSRAVLIVARLVQGLAGAVVAPASLSILTSTFTEPAERHRAVGIWGAMGGAGGAAGVLLGGIITDALSWRWIFFINLPIGLIAAFLSQRMLLEGRNENATRNFDFGGALTATSACRPSSTESCAPTAPAGATR